MNKMIALYIFFNLLTSAEATETKEDKWDQTYTRLLKEIIPEYENHHDKYIIEKKSLVNKSFLRKKNSKICHNILLIENSTFNSESINEIEEILNENTRFDTIRIIHSQLDNAQATRILETLEGYQNVRTLDLSYNKIDTISKQVESLILKNDTLKTINLSNNMIKDDEAIKLFFILYTTYNIKYMHLSENEISKEIKDYLEKKYRELDMKSAEKYLFLGKNSFSIF